MAFSAVREDGHDDRLVDGVPGRDAALEARHDLADPGAQQALDLVEGQAQQPVGLHRVPHQRVALEPDAPRPASQSATRLRRAASRHAPFRLVTAPVEGQRRGVEQPQPEVGVALEVERGVRAEALDPGGGLRIGAAHHAHEVERDVAECERVAPLLHGDAGVGERRAVEVEQRQLDLAVSVLHGRGERRGAGVSPLTGPRWPRSRPRTRPPCPSPRRSSGPGTAPGSTGRRRR